MQNKAPRHEDDPNEDTFDDDPATGTPRSNASTADVKLRRASK